MAPDPYFARKMPQLSEPVYFCDLAPAQNIRLRTYSPQLREQYFLFEIGALIAYADGILSLKEKSFFYKRILSIDINPVDKTRLRMNVLWLLEHPPHFKKITTSLTRLPEEKKEDIALFLLQTMSADEQLDLKGEKNMLIKLFKLLDVPTDRIFQYIHSSKALTAPLNPLPMDRPLSKPFQSSSETLATASSFNTPPLQPEPQAQKQNLTLPESDPESNEDERAKAVNSPKPPTQDQGVGGLLDRIFSEDEEESFLWDDGGGDDDPIKHNTVSGLDPQHETILTVLLKKDHWHEDELYHLVGAVGLMLRGTVEVINEWTYDRFEENLLHIDETSYTLNKNIREQIDHLYKRAVLSH